jgi:hypothetical protein
MKIRQIVAATLLVGGALAATSASRLFLGQRQVGAASFWDRCLGHLQFHAHWDQLRR